MTDDLYLEGWGHEPNPGSTKAFEKGCRCPRMDNGHGRGYHHYDGKETRVWVTLESCTIHWKTRVQ